MRFKSELRAVHGGRGKYLTGIEKELLDFSANINPYPPKLDLAIPDDALTRYPDDDYLLLKEAIARHHGCKPENITVGNGSVEVIRTLCHTVLDKGQKYLVPDHTFAEYELSARLAGAERTNDYKEASLSFICNPDNPSGILLQKQEILSRLSRIPGITKIIFSVLMRPLSTLQTPLIRYLAQKSWSLSFDPDENFAIAGVRFGYGR